MKYPGSRLLLTGLLGACGALLFSLPAVASTLQFWRFNANENRLVFVTNSRVQPRAQFLVNPSRLVIDLPGVTLGRPTIRQSFGSVFQEVRIGQADAQTTRIVIELGAGYTLDPQQVRFRGATASQWSVELPPLQRL